MAEPEALRKALGEALRAEGGCLEVETLEAFLEGALPSAERERVAEHLKACGPCGAELRLFESFRSASPEASEARDVEWIARRIKTARLSPAPVRRGRLASLLTSLSGWNVRRLSLVAASLLVVVATGVFFHRPPVPGLDTSAGDRTPVFRSGEIRGLDPAGDLASAPAAFRWESVPGAATYEVHLLEVDRNEIWNSRAAAAAQRPPEVVRRRMVPGKTLLWKVVAFDAGGRRIAESGFQEFRVTPGR